MNALELHGVQKTYPGFTLGPIDLELPGGTVCGLIGENGAGKSTTLKLILGILPPESGTIRVLGKDDLEAQIVHEPDCQEENICHPDDVAWLNNFYSRIMNQTDPLALYLKSSKVNPLTKTQKESNYSPQRKKIHHKTKRSANFTLFFIILIVLIFVLLIVMFLFQK